MDFLPSKHKESLTNSNSKPDQLVKATEITDVLRNKCKENIKNIMTKYEEIDAKCPKRSSNRKKK